VKSDNGSMGSADPGQRKQWAHAVHRHLRVAQQARAIGQAEELGEVDNRPGALVTVDHPEVTLVAVEVGKENDTGLVEAGRRFEDMAGKRDCRRQDRIVTQPVTGVEFAGARRDRSSDRAPVDRRAMLTALRIAVVTGQSHLNNGKRTEPHK
jgi:hypothetical protein